MTPGRGGGPGVFSVCLNGYPLGSSGVKGSRWGTCALPAHARGGSKAGDAARNVAPKHVLFQHNVTSTSGGCHFSTFGRNVEQL